MKNKEFDKNNKQKFVIETKQGNVEIAWSRDERPGFCPHCHKCIPLHSIVFQKENENGTETYSGMDAVKMKKCNKSEEEKLEKDSKIGECPYCQKEIPIREVVFKKLTDEKIDIEII